MKRSTGKAAVALTMAVLVVGALSLVRADVATPRARWTTVRMESEKVNITLGEKLVKVEAVFQMYNEGPAGSVKMGYPLGVFEKKLNDFKAFVGDKQIKGVRTESGGGGRSVPGAYRLAGAPIGPGGRKGGPNSAKAEPYRFAGPYKQWHVFDVPMGSHDRKEVKVTYWVEPAKVVDAKKGVLLHYSYTLRTGATWKGKIGEAVINVTLADVEPGRVIRRAPAGAKVGKGGRTLTWTMRNFKPVDNIEITYSPSKAVRTAMRGRK